MFKLVFQYCTLPGHNSTDSQVAVGQLIGQKPGCQSVTPPAGQKLVKTGYSANPDLVDLFTFMQTAQQAFAT